MMRVVLLSVALMAAPFVIYAIYEIVRRGPDGTGPRRIADWERGIVLRLTMVGAALAFGGLALVISMQDGGERGDTYVPSRFENGELVPGGFEPAGD